MMRFSGWVSLGAIALLAGCASKPAPAPEPRPAPPVAPLPSPPPPPPLAWEDRPPTPGGWVYSREGSGSQALFGPPDAEASFLVRCDPARRQVTLAREGTGGQLTIRTSTVARTLAAASRTEPLAYLTASLTAADPLLDAMVFSRGRFAVEAAGLPMLVLPTWPEPARVVEDCRS